MGEETNINKILGRTEAWDRETIADLRAQITTLTAQRDEALKYGAPENTKALSWVKSPCKVHNQYWTTFSGSCMACRAVDAETKLAHAQSDLAGSHKMQTGLVRDVQAYAAQVADLESQLATANAERDKARACMERLVAERDAANASLDMCNVAHASLGRELEEARATEERLHRSIDSLLSNNTDVRAQLAAAFARIDRLRAECKLARLGVTVNESAPLYLARAACDTHHDINTGGASDALRAQADVTNTKEGAD